MENKEGRLWEEAAQRYAAITLMQAGSKASSEGSNRIFVSLGLTSEQLGKQRMHGGFRSVRLGDSNRQAFAHAPCQGSIHAY